MIVESVLIIHQTDRFEGVQDFIAKEGSFEQ